MVPSFLRGASMHVQEYDSLKIYNEIRVLVRNWRNVREAVEIYVGNLIWMKLSKEGVPRLETPESSSISLSTFDV
jgi:hypothetical protein